MGSEALASGASLSSSFVEKSYSSTLSQEEPPPAPTLFFHCLPTLPQRAIHSVFCALLLVGRRWAHPEGSGWDPTTEEHWPHAVARAAGEYRHLHCAPSLPQGRSEPVFEEVPIVQMTKVSSCLDVFEHQLDPETSCHPSLSIMYS